MPATAETVYYMICKIATDHKVKKEVELVEHRADYGDYRVTLITPGFEPEDELSLEGKFHAELREGLINILTTDPTHGDTIREIVFKLKHPVEYTEFD